jgi:2'-hydroxyisoflavone reductase
MRLLVIGGTVFVGRAVVAAALARGHAVTIFHRGLHNPDLFPEAERVLGDRTLDLSALHGREWDAVIDTCGFEPEHVAATAELLADRVGHYGFVSSVSVYPDSDGTLMTEDSPVFEGAEREYGPLKAACERAAEAAMPGRVLAARAGVIVGPHENIGRLPRWLWRCAEGGEVLAPGPPAASIQLIDARDLAAWMLDMAETARAGTYNATPDQPSCRAPSVVGVDPRGLAEPGSATWGELLEAVRTVTGGRAELRWADPAWIEERVAEPWDELPLWPIPSLPGLYAVSGARAAAAGLAPRPLAATVADTWAWLSSGGTLDDWRTEMRAGGLSAEAERGLLAALRS